MHRLEHALYNNVRETPSAPPGGRVALRRAFYYLGRFIGPFRLSPNTKLYFERSNCMDVFCFSFALLCEYHRDAAGGRYRARSCRSIWGLARADVHINVVVLVRSGGDQLGPAARRHPAPRPTPPPRDLCMPHLCLAVFSCSHHR